MVLMRRGFVAWALLAMLLFSCDAAATPAPPPPSVSTSAAASPSREPTALPRYPEEQAVLDVLTASGMRVELVGASKFETLLGAPRRARVFIGTMEGSRVGADVLFLDAPPGDVRVCKTAGTAPGFTHVVITVDGRPGSTGDGSQSMSFAVSDRYFVMSSDVRVRDALRVGLGLSEPRC
jgi:hypothetical protein